MRHIIATTLATLMAAPTFAQLPAKPAAPTEDPLYRRIDALDKPMQTALLKAGADAEARGWAASERVNAETLAKLKAEGMQVLSPSPQLKSDMKKVGDVMLKEWQDKAGPEGKSLVDTYKAK